MPIYVTDEKQLPWKNTKSDVSQIERYFFSLVHLTSKNSKSVPMNTQFSVAPPFGSFPFHGAFCGVKGKISSLLSNLNVPSLAASEIPTQYLSSETSCAFEYT